MGSSVITILCIVAAELQKVHIALGHVVFDRRQITGSDLLITLQKCILLCFRFHKLLPRPSEHCPSDIKIPVSYAGQFKVQYAAYMMSVPQDIRIVEISVAEALDIVLRRIRKKGFVFLQV